MLLTIGLYHLTSRARSPAAFLARGSEQTVLGDLTGVQTGEMPWCSCSTGATPSGVSVAAAVELQRYVHHCSMQRRVMKALVWRPAGYNISLYFTKPDNQVGHVGDLQPARARLRHRS